MTEPTPTVISWVAFKDDRKVWADTAKEAVRLFLEQYKSRSFSVHEYRNGFHTRVFHLRAGLPKSSEDCQSIDFASRAEARAFLEQGE